MNETRGLLIARVTPRVGPPQGRSASYLWQKIRSRRTIDRPSDRIGLGAGHEFRRTSSSDTALRRPVCHLLCLCLCRVSVFSLSRHRNCSGALSFRRVWCCVCSPVFKWGYKIRIPDGNIQQISRMLGRRRNSALKLRYPNDSGNTIIRIIPVIFGQFG